MRIVCSATVDDEIKRGNLCTCIKITGGNPEVNGNKVTVEYNGSVEIATRFIALFERYPDHSICTLERR